MCTEVWTLLKKTASKLEDHLTPVTKGMIIDHNFPDDPKEFYKNFTPFPEVAEANRKIWKTIINFTETPNFKRKSKFWQKTKLLSKIEIFIENRNFEGKSKFWEKAEFLTENRNFDRKSKFWKKTEILTERRNFDTKSEL